MALRRLSFRGHLYDQSPTEICYLRAATTEKHSRRSHGTPVGEALSVALHPLRRSTADSRPTLCASKDYELMYKPSEVPDSPLPGIVLSLMQIEENTYLN